MHINREISTGYQNPRNAIWLGERSLIKPSAQKTNQQSIWTEPINNSVSSIIQNNREEFDKGIIENVQLIIKKKKRRLPGESLVRKYTLELQDLQNFIMDNNENIQNSHEDMKGGCMDGKQCPTQSSCGENKNVNKKKKQRGRGIGSAIMSAVSGASGSPGIKKTIMVLVEFLVRALLRGTKLGTRGQVKKAKKMLAEALTEAVDEVEISPDDTVTDNIKTISRSVADSIGKKLSKVVQSEDVGEYESKKINTGLSRILTKVAKGKLKHGDASTDNAIKLVANRAGKGFTARCGRNPLNCLLGVAGVTGGIAAMANPATAAFGVASLAQGITSLA